MTDRWMQRCRNLTASGGGSRSACGFSSRRVWYACTHNTTSQLISPGRDDTAPSSTPPDPGSCPATGGRVGFTDGTTRSSSTPASGIWSSVTRPIPAGMCRGCLIEGMNIQVRRETKTLLCHPGQVPSAISGRDADPGPSRQIQRVISTFHRSIHRLGPGSSSYPAKGGIALRPG